MKSLAKIVFGALSVLFWCTNANAQTIDIGPNQYAFQFTGDPDFGLYFNADNSRYEFRNGAATSIFGFSANNGSLTTNLEFSSGSDLLIGNNRYAFRAASNPNYGLFFNAATLEYQFLNNAAVPIFAINVNTGRFSTGAVTYPHTDGTDGQVLTTDGLGMVTWTTRTVLADENNDTKIQVEENEDDDMIRFDMAGTEFFRMDNGRLEVLNTGYSVFIGEGAGASDNLTDNRNVFIGYQAGKANTDGRFNTASGSYSLYKNETGNYNTASGSYSLYDNETGSQNSASGYLSLSNNTEGDNNTASGYSSLFYNTTGSYRTGVGRSANYFGNAHENNTGLGYYANPTASNKVRVGNTSVTEIGGQVSWSTLSDRRFKTDVKQDEVKGLEFISRLQPVTYNYDIDAYADWIEKNYGERDTANWKGKYDIEKIRFSGFIAQDVEQIAQETGYDFSGVSKPANDKDIYSLRYAEFVVPLVKAVQEQQTQIEQLNADKEEQQGTIEEQNNDIGDLKNTVEDVAAENADLRNANEKLATDVDDLKEAMQRFEQDLQSCCFNSEGGSAVGTNNTSGEDAELGQNIPNPFSESTIIRYYFPDGTNNAIIRVTDMGGSPVQDLQLAAQRGANQVEFQTQGLASATYLYSLFVDGKFIDTKKMVIMK